MNIKQSNIFNYHSGTKTFKPFKAKDKIEIQKKDFSLQKDYKDFKSLFASSRLKIKQRNNSQFKRIKSSKTTKNRKTIFDLNTKTLNNKYNDKDEEKNNNLNNISLYSTQCINEEKIPKYQKTYYFLDNKERDKKRFELLKTSYNFNKYNNDRAIIRMITRFKNKEELEMANKEYIKKYKQFSYTKRVQTKIAFGKGSSNIEIPEIDNNYNFNKKRKQQKTKKIKPSEKIKELFIKGFNLKTEDNIIKNNNQINDIEKKQLFITNSNLEKQNQKDCFGNEIYPILAKHKILQNILPNEVDYNTKTSIADIVNSEIHPLLRFQKKIMTQSSNLISQELNVLFSKFISLSKLNPDKANLKRNDLLIELQKDDRFIELMRTIIGKDKEKEKLLQDKINEEEKKRKLIRRKYLFKKFKEIILLSFQKMKKYNIDIHIFYSLMNINKDDENFQKEFMKKGQYLFRVIKAGDIDEIINVINEDNYLVSYKDEFFQIPLHICAKRNIYQIIAFLLSRLSPIDSQDESGRTPLMIAAKNNHLEFLTILLFENANPKIKDNNSNLASDLTNNEKIKFILKRAEALHSLRVIVEGKNINKMIVSGLDFLYKKELEINYDKWINQGLKILKDSRQSFL